MLPWAKKPSSGSKTNPSLKLCWGGNSSKKGQTPPMVSGYGSCNKVTKGFMWNQSRSSRGHKFHVLPPNKALNGVTKRFFLSSGWHRAAPKSFSCHGIAQMESRTPAEHTVFRWAALHLALCSKVLGHKRKGRDRDCDLWRCENLFGNQPQHLQ